MATFYRLQFSPPSVMRPGSCAHLHSTPEAAANCPKGRKVKAKGGTVKVIQIERRNYAREYHQADVSHLP